MAAFWLGMTLLILVGGGILLMRSQARLRRTYSDTAPEPVLSSGTKGTAQVLSLDRTGFSSGEWYLCRIGLRVAIPGREPYDVTIQQRVDIVRLPAVQPGMTVAVRVDPADPVIVGIEGIGQQRSRSSSHRYLSAADLLASGQRARGVLESFTDTGKTPRSLGESPSQPEFLDDPMYTFEVDLMLPNRAPIRGRCGQRVPRAQVHKLAIGLELDCVVDPADPSRRFVVDWGDIAR